MLQSYWLQNQKLICILWTKGEKFSVPQWSYPLIVVSFNKIKPLNYYFLPYWRKKTSLDLVLKLFILEIKYWNKKWLYKKLILTRKRQISLGGKNKWKNMSLMFTLLHSGLGTFCLIISWNLIGSIAEQDNHIENWNDRI